jgi:hypothetical protein
VDFLTGIFTIQCNYQNFRFISYCRPISEPENLKSPSNDKCQIRIRFTIFSIYYQHELVHFPVPKQILNQLSIPSKLTKLPKSSAPHLKFLMICKHFHKYSNWLENIFPSIAIKDLSSFYSEVSN